MKALTIQQPWASLVATGVKKYETRCWSPPEKMLGEQIVIHAGSGFEKTAPHLVPLIPGLSNENLFELMPIGAIIAVVRIAFVWQATEAIISHEERALGNYTAGNYAWRLTDLQKLPEPIPFKGQQGLWDVPRETINKIQEMIENV